MRLDVVAFASLIQTVLRGGPFPDNTRALPLLLGTCAQESAFIYFTQLGGGPARGLFQCEPSTETDIWANFLAYQPALRDFFALRCGRDGPDVQALEHNMVYQIILARTQYYRRDPDRLPPPQDLEAQAHVWKRYYNTSLRGGTEAQYIKSFNTLVRPYIPLRPTKKGRVSHA
jgi:hypothetical protein